MAMYGMSYINATSKSSGTLNMNHTVCYVIRTEPQLYVTGIISTIRSIRFTATHFVTLHVSVYS
jgi:hypothetical protein